MRVDSCTSIRAKGLQADEVIRLWVGDIGCIWDNADFSMSV